MKAFGYVTCCLAVALGCDIATAANAPRKDYVSPIQKTGTHGLSWGEEYAKRIQSAQTVSALGDEMFGDQVNLFDGSTSFTATDISLPGNSVLPVALTRTMRTQEVTGDLPLGMWDIDVPRISSIQPASGWAPSSRCSTVATPPPVGTAPNTFTAREYWGGTQLSAPGGGGALLSIGADTKLVKPAMAGTFKWTTKGGWYFTCLPSLQSGTGEGFMGYAPDGTRYRFDWMVDRFYPGISKHNYNAPFPAAIQRRSFGLYATEVTDRFGNWVRYDWTGGRLNRIYANDGREIVLAYASNGRLLTATVPGATPASNRVWIYEYDSMGVILTSVVNPDGSRWRYATQGTGFLNRIEYQTRGNGEPLHDDAPICVTSRLIKQTAPRFVVTHPSGAQAEYSFAPMHHGRTHVPYKCLPGDNPNDDAPQDDFNDVSVVHDVMSLQSKRVTGPGLVAGITTYAYASLEGGYRPKDPITDAVTGATPPPHYKTVTVTAPDGTQHVNTFGKDYGLNEGQLLRTDINKASVAYRTTVNAYVTEGEIAGMPFPGLVGSTLMPGGDDFSAAALRPVKTTTVTQNGATFNASTTLFDNQARPRSVARSSSLGHSKTDTTEYYDDLSRWVLGQVKRSLTNGIETGRTSYTGNAQPHQTHAYGKLQQTLTYNTDGTVATVSDGRDGSAFNTTLALSNWKRGIPQRIQYPATPDQPAGASMSAVVNADGTLASVTDENGSKTCYGYDAIGRLNTITHPSETVTGVCDSSAWAPTTITFDDGHSAVYGMPAGHWRQTTLTGRARKVVVFDALWRPVAEQTMDLDRVSTTMSEVFKRYDAVGRLAFQSYPMNTGGAATYTDSALKGVTYSYDALDRLTKAEQDWEHTGRLTTTTEYLAGFQTRITNPRGQQTTTRYLAWDQPGTDLPIAIVHPEGQYTDIVRDAFGKPTTLTRRNANSSTWERKYFYYNAAQELCKTKEVQTGITAMGYDAAGNLAWSAPGLPWSSDATCEYTAATAATRRADRTYDARNRLKTLNFPDGQGDQTWIYTPDGLPAQIVAANPGTGGHSATTTYAYNKRRLAMTETLQYGSVLSWPVHYAYNVNGHLSAQNWHGLNVTYAPNALGQPTQAGSFASAVSYFPNGALKQFTYGNGLKHTLTQNARQLPDTSCDFPASGSCGAGAVLNDGYDYDESGNVKAISDGRTGNRGDRTMTYDGLDRLTAVTSPMYGTGAVYTYDALDNLTRAKLGATPRRAARDHYYCYDTAWRLTFVRSGPNCTGTASPAVGALTYDVQGNLRSKDAVTYLFDYGNRLRMTTGAVASNYAYDGHGRRVWDKTGNDKYSHYLQNGQLSMTADQRSGEVSEYVYLQGSLVAIRVRDAQTDVYNIKYQHTDALGSPIAVTNATGAVIERTEYEPYGQVLNRPNSNGVGYTGHMLDAATGLNYMQQRYYDPDIGRFLSVDPVTAYDIGDMRHFNAYAYAYNNPYKFSDPDGRCAVCPHLARMAGGAAGSAAFEIGVQVVFDGKRSWAEIDKSDVVVAGAVGAVLPGGFTFAKRAHEAYPRIKKAIAAYKNVAGQSRNTPNRAAKLAEREREKIAEVTNEIRDVTEVGGAAATGVLLKSVGQDAANKDGNEQKLDGLKVVEVQGKIDSMRLSRDDRERR